MNTYLEGMVKQPTFDLQKLAFIINKFNPSFRLAQTDADINKVLDLRKKVYPTCYPESYVDSLDTHDNNSLLLFTENEQGECTSCCRLVFDSHYGFAEEDIYQPFIEELRKQGHMICEWGRCIVTNQSPVRAFDYADLIHHLAQELHINHVLIFNRECDVDRVLKKLQTANVLTSTDKTFGSKHKFTALLWSIKKETIYEPDLWDDYALSFMTLTTTYQMELLRESVKHLYGHVVDCGSGCAKIAPYLARQNTVQSYTGIDACEQMCALGHEVLAKLDKPEFQMVESYIEYVQDYDKYDSAVSINSLYTWSEPLAVLRHIFQMIRSGGNFVLANVNDNLDIDKLVLETKTDFMFHPHIDAFCDINIDIAHTKDANRFSLNELIQLVHQAGFKVLICHEEFFEGGLCFMVLQKP